MYRTLSSYLKEKYGGKIKKICIDGGFTCPNRDGTSGVGGCIYCGERGAGEHIDPTKSISEQVSAALANGKADGYIAYFQNFTNTYAPVDVLRERYLSALIDERIKVLAIGTRPDCITPEICKLLKELSTKVDIWVELGLQTSNDITAKLIRRGYDLSVYRAAAQMLNGYGIPFVTHMIVGLPGEGEADALATAEEIKASGAFGIKIHSLYVMEGTDLADMYRAGLYTPISFDEYTQAAAKVLDRIGDDLVVHRITGDCPKDMLVAPNWNADKQRVIAEIRRKLEMLG